MSKLEAPEFPEKKASPRPVLSSWKEIAGYLKIDIRTCQRWENTFGLPVHRIGQSSRSRVIAYPEELDGWRDRTFRAKSKVAGGVGGAEVDEAAAAGPAKKRFFSTILVLLAVAVIGAGGFLLFPVDRNPADFHIDHQTLIITNKSGRELWRFDTHWPALTGESFYRERFQAKTSIDIEDEGKDIRFPFLLIRDLNGDGRREILFAPQSSGATGEGRVYFFNDRGVKIGDFRAGREIKIGERIFPPDYVVGILDVQDFDRDGRMEILVGSHCFNESPTQIAILDLHGTVLGEYWHFGQLVDLAYLDLDKVRNPDIVLIGQNNEYEGPCAIILDPLNLKKDGCSPQGPDSKIAGLEEGREKLYIRFPKSELDAPKLPRGTFQCLTQTKNGHLIFETRFSHIQYDFDPDFSPPQIILTDGFRLRYQAALREKQVEGPLDRDAEIKKLAKGIFYYESGKWVVPHSIGAEGSRN